MTKILHTALAVALLSSLGLTLAACGDDDSGSNEEEECLTRECRMTAFMETCFSACDASAECEGGGEITIADAKLQCQGWCADDLELAFGSGFDVFDEGRCAIELLTDVICMAIEECGEHDPECDEFLGRPDDEFVCLTF